MPAGNDELERALSYIDMVLWQEYQIDPNALVVRDSHPDYSQGDALAEARLWLARAIRRPVLKPKVQKPRWMGKKRKKKRRR